MFLYFTVNPGQTAMWESGFLIEVYTWRAFCGRKISPKCPLLLFNRGFLWTLLEGPRPNMPVLRP